MHGPYGNYCYHDQMLISANIIMFKGDVHPYPCQTSKMELFAKIVNGFQPLFIFSANSTLDI